MEYTEYTAPKKQKSGRIIAIVIVLALLIGMASGAITATLVSNQILSENKAQTNPQTSTTSSTTTSGIIVSTNTSGEQFTPATVYSAYINSVVAVSTESTTTNIFGQVAKTAASGSGFILTSDGYIATNCHVIEDAQVVTVTLKDGTSYPAKIVGSDDQSDVALLKIEATGLTTVSIGDSDSLTPGEMVAAIGNPLGELTGTLTVGYVSAIDREIAMSDGTTLNMIQTDAAINEGNSGGPLFDMEGNVIGITTAKYASDTIEGLGFAIPINDAMNIINELKTNGYVSGRPSIGVELYDLSSMTMSRYGLTSSAYVSAVTSGSAAAKAGMNEGDVITAVGGTSVTCVSDIKSELSKLKAGTEMTITIWRNGKTQTLNITLDEKKQDSSDTSEITPSSYYSNSSETM